MGILKVKVSGGTTLVLEGPESTTEIYFEAKSQLAILAPEAVRVFRRKGELSPRGGSTTTRDTKSAKG